MRIFVINLARRPDRMAAMAARLGELGLAYTRIEAVDAKTTAPEELNSHFSDKGPTGVISRGDKACSLSHFRAWEAFLQSDDSHGVILEDDVFVHDAARQLLASADWIPDFVHLLKIERFGPPSQRVLLGPGRRLGEREIAPLLSKHTGTAGYVLTRDIAELLVHMKPREWNQPIDYLLFNPNTSWLLKNTVAWQLTPAFIEQREEIGGKTDIHGWRTDHRPRGLAYVKREAVRGWYEFRLVPKQIFALATGRARLKTVPVG